MAEEEKKEKRAYYRAPAKKHNERGAGRPKGSRNKYQRDKIAESKTTKLAPYQEYLATGNADVVSLGDISYAVSYIRARRKGTPKQPMFKSVEDLHTCIKAYWDYVAVANEKGIRLVPDVEGVASFLGISRGTLIKWEQTNYQDWGEELARLRTDIASVKKQLAFNGKIPPIVFATDFNNNHDYKQKQDTVIVATSPFGNEPSIESIKDKYLNGLDRANVIDAEFTEIKEES